jgi:hypothetical protein
VKTSGGTLAAIVALSLGVWLFFYLSPGAPLTGPETAVVVGACAGAVLLVRWLWGRRRRPGPGDDRAG